MEILRIEGTSRTPKIEFDPFKGKFKIEGASIPEDTLSFFKQVFEWADEYVKTPAGSTELEVNLEYFNTSSSKCLYTLFNKLEKLLPAPVEIIWYYDLKDTDMFESGNDFMNMVKVPFKVVRK